MKQSPSWESSRFSASQEIPRILWNPQVQYRIHTCPPSVHMLSQPNPVHIPTSHILTIHPNIILPSTPGSSKWSLSLKFHPKKSAYASPLPHTCYMPRPPRSCRFDYPKNIWWAVQIISSLLCSFHRSPVTSSLLRPNILLSTPFSITLTCNCNINSQLCRRQLHANL